MDYEGHSYTITSIGDNAFRYSTISSITIAEGIVSVGQYALRNCTSLTTLTFPNSCIRFGRTAVGDCTSLTQIYFGANHITFSDNFGRLCGKQLTDAYFECAQPPTVGSYFFNNNQSLTLHVPADALDAYRKALPLSTYPNFRFAILGASYESLQTMITDYANRLPLAREIGTNPGYYSQRSVDNMTHALTQAQGLTPSTDIATISDAMQEIIEAHSALYIYPLQEGIYSVANCFAPSTAMFSDAATTATATLKTAALNPDDDRCFFRITRQGNDWVMQNVATSLYVSAPTGGSPSVGIAMSHTPTHTIRINWSGGGQFSIQSINPNGTLSPTLCLGQSKVESHTYQADDPKASRALWQFIPAPSTRYVQTFNIENPMVHNYLSSVTYNQADASQISRFNTSTALRLDQPLPVTLFWPRATEAISQSIILSTDKTFSDPLTLSIDSLATSCELFNLIPNQTYYYQVIALLSNGETLTLADSQFATSGQLRMIKADGVANLRDLGGWPTTTGKTIRYGYLYRGTAINASTITSSDIRSLLDLGIKIELDLRSDSEAGQQTASLLGSDVEYKRISLGQTATYYDGLTNHQAKYGQDLAYIFKCVKDDKPVYFHCAIGADRTGTLAFLIEGLLGVSESDLYKDYELTTLSGNTRTKSNLDKDAINYIKSMSGETLAEKFRTYCTDILNLPATDIDLFTTKMLIDPTDDTLTATGYHLSSTPSQCDVYAINGTLIRRNADPTSPLRGLPRNTYIVNGQKIATH